MPDDLTKTLLLEEAAPPNVVAEALFASVTEGVPFLHALLHAGAATEETLTRYLARAQAPALKQVLPVLELLERLPPGLPERLLAIPVRRDAITGTVDVVVADASDPHPGREISFHLRAPVRLVRAPLGAIEDALRRIRTRSREHTVAAPPLERDDEHLYDSRPRMATPPPSAYPRGRADNPYGERVPRPSRVPAVERQAHVVPAPTRLSAPVRRAGHDTPPWGTPVHNATVRAQSEAPTSRLGSEIPIPLMRRTFTAVSGGTQRPPPLRSPTESALGEGYPVDPGSLRAVVEVQNERDGGRGRSERAPAPSRYPAPASAYPTADTFIPRPPAVPGTGAFSAYTNPEPPRPIPDGGTVLAAIRNASTRDEILDLVLVGARAVALRIALFAVKRGAAVGWSCTPEFGDMGALPNVAVPLDGTTAFDTAARDDVFLGPIPYDEAHAPMLHVMHRASRDVAVIPIRVSGKPVMMIVADELGDTMLATRRIEELARAAGDAFARIVRAKR
ncbi:FrgA [Labilithrix luteola]|uniref:FrgA n=1 Tax=Labilithrix luteola TaxID=1391654 RepID=A0A0K1Q5M4_9BACT|nr:hypothetical protein [Labilithrix luteola]AKV01038.1 FrgA [Labilithrix luteola]